MAEKIKPAFDKVDDEKLKVQQEAVAKIQALLTENNLTLIVEHAVKVISK